MFEGRIEWGTLLASPGMYSSRRLDFAMRYDEQAEQKVRAGVS